jgi:glycosyltransferase involved in cell wall biosynthesis
MRIAVWHNLPSGGGKRALYDHVRGLVSRGHEVEAWCPPTADRSYLALSEIVREHVVPLQPTSNWREKPLGEGILHRMRWNPWARLRAMERHSRECAQQINESNFDLLFAASCILYHTPPIGRFVAIPRVVYLGEPNRPLYEAQPELLWPALFWTPKDLLAVRFWRRALGHRIQLSTIRMLAREERRNALAFDEILVNSLFSRESVLRAFGVNSTVCYLGVDTDKFFNQEKKREFFVVFVGALIPTKNVEFLIASLAKVAAHLRPKLVLVANTIAAPYWNSIQRLAQQSAVVLELRHLISDTELLDILNRARIMLYAPRLEPFGYAPLEASACGLPVVAVAEGGVRETIRDGVNGILVEHDPESMAAAIEHLMRDDELHRRLSAQALNLAKVVWSLGPSIDRLERRLRCHAELGSIGPRTSGKVLC